ncbi:MAG: undecaprenyl-diphosphate phosphatase [Gemmatimonadota bacterium]
MREAMAALLGAVQGFTEFLPVSSSGHLVLAERILGVTLPGVAFEVTVHVASLCAVLWAYRARIHELVRGVCRRERESLTYAGLLGLATVPAGVVGLVWESALEGLFDVPRLAAALLLASGLLAWSVKRSAPAAQAGRPDAPRALGIGMAQAVAIIPGVSRSGATLAVGSWLGVDAVRMAEFSFLMSVPAIAGAAVLQVGEFGAAVNDIGPGFLLTGFATALVSGIVAIRIFVRMLEHRTFHRFAYYCWSVGLGYLVAAAFLPGLRG